MGRKPSKKITPRFLILTEKEDMISAIKERHLQPVRVANANGFITIADVEDYYENSYAQKNRYMPLSWSEFMDELKKRNLYVVKDIKTGFVKLVTESTVKKYRRYYINGDGFGIDYE